MRKHGRVIEGLENDLKGDERLLRVSERFELSMVRVISSESTVAFKKLALFSRHSALPYFFNF